MAPDDDVNDEACASGLLDCSDADVSDRSEIANSSSGNESLAERVDKSASLDDSGDAADAATIADTDGAEDDATRAEVNDGVAVTLEPFLTRDVLTTH